MGQIKRILILGAHGMAGHMINEYLRTKTSYEVYALSRNRPTSDKEICLDVRETIELEKIIKSFHFDVIINCIGLLNENAEKNIEKAIWLNSYFPHLLKMWSLNHNFKLIHISTDCVFSGRDGGYNESSESDGIGIYARSKALGEVLDDKNLTIRTSIIGPELKSDGIGLFHWFMNQENKIMGYRKSIWSGVTTLQLAKSITSILNSEITGIYHLTNNNPISKAELLELFKKYTLKDIEIENIDGKYSNKSLIDNRKLLLNEIPDYDQMIQEMVRNIRSKREVYPHYRIT